MGHQAGLKVKAERERPQGNQIHEIHDKLSPTTRESFAPHRTCNTLQSDTNQLPKLRLYLTHYVNLSPQRPLRIQTMSNPFLRWTRCRM